ncbi:MAG: glycosyltransferase [Planctomycetes bacterium]|nr:glycosyltransferase [Planctomycetota bacterium]
MHILHVDPEMGYSGGEVQVFLLLDGLMARGHRCTVAAQPGSRVEEEARVRGWQVLPIPMRADWDVLAVHRLTRALRRLKPDLVHLHTGRANWIGGWAAFRAGLPAVSTRRMDRKVRKNFKNRLIYGRFVQRTAAISRAVLGQLHAAGIPQERTVHISSVVDPSRLQVARTREEVRLDFGLSDGEWVCLCAGALVPRKGFDVLIEALSRVDGKLHLWVAGDGSEAQALEELARDLQVADRVHFLGQRADLADWLAAADLFAMPSRAEGLGIAALEAMASGLPVLASDVGGLRDLVDSGVTGELLPVGDVGAWCAALGQWMKDRAGTVRMGEAGRQRVQERFLPDRMVEAYLKLYGEVLEERA